MMSPRIAKALEAIAPFVRTVPMWQIDELRERERLTIQLRQLGWTAPENCSNEWLSGLLDRALEGEVQKPPVAT